MLQVNPKILARLDGLEADLLARWQGQEEVGKEQADWNSPSGIFGTNAA